MHLNTVCALLGCTATVSLTAQQITSEYPTEGQIRSTKDEQFYISLLDIIKPFCINTPKVTPYAYHNKRGVHREWYQWSMPAQAVADIVATNTR